jgi:hypothetical protein
MKHVDDATVQSAGTAAAEPTLAKAIAVTASATLKLFLSIYFSPIGTSRKRVTYTEAMPDS